MQSFKHYLITRFNIVQDWYGSKDKNGKPVQSEKWLSERFRLFEKYCFPSVMNQSNENFIWLVLFNSETPVFYKHKIEELIKKSTLLMPLFLDPNGDEEKMLTDYIINNKTVGKSHIITSRLDNDDAIHKNYIEEVQNQFNENILDIFVNFSNGFQYDENKHLLMKMRSENNHFTSRILKIVSNEIKTVLCDHTQVTKHAKVTYINNETALWMEVVHKSNKLNHTILAKPFYDLDFRKMFGLTVMIHYSIIFYYCLNFAIWLIMKFFRKSKKACEKYSHIIGIN